VPLGGVEVLQVRRRVRAAGVIEVGHGVGAGAGAGGRASVWREAGQRVSGKGLVGVGPASPNRTYRKLGVFWRGRDGVGTHDGPRHLQTSSRS
jgi:hypothetical protein